MDPVKHAGAPEKPLVSAHESEDEVSPKAGVAGSNPAGGTIGTYRVTCERLRRLGSPVLRADDAARAHRLFTAWPRG